MAAQDTSRLVRIVSAYRTCNKKVASMPQEARQFWHDARWIVRAGGPFVDVHHVFPVGMGMGDEDEPDDDENLSAEERRRIHMQYKIILHCMPGLDADLTALGSDVDTLRGILDILGDAITASRSDDIGTIKGNILKYIPPVDAVPPIPCDADKIGRGWRSPQCAHMLCPVDMLDDFDQDRTVFCNKVLTGTIHMSGDDFPLFLYEDFTFDPENLEKGLLRGKPLIDAGRCLLTGPLAARKPTPGKDGNSRPLVMVYRDKLCAVTPEIIAYVAVLTRFGLSGEAKWSGDDWGFSYSAFFDAILDLFAAPSPWVTDTLEWWNLWIFGSPEGRVSSRRGRGSSDRQTTRAKLAQQRADRLAQAQQQY